MNITDDHYLEDADREFTTTKTSGDFTNLDTIVLHYTAGRSARSSAITLCDPEVKASAHLIIGREGELFQLAPFNIRTWHAGKSSYLDRSGLNKYSIGIEIDNAGELERSGISYYSWFGKKYGENEVIHATDRNQNSPKYWHLYKEEQIDVTEQICRALVKKYEIKYILGHEEIAPTRKIDPGPAFPLDHLRESILATDRDSDDADDFPAHGIVTARKLNIRADSSGAGEKIAKPLPKNSEVTVMEERNNWYRVRTQIEGWVSADYIDLIS
jgi:N-acetylmuramoyl-L-alanine amidase